MTSKQEKELGIWGGEAANWLHMLAGHPMTPLDAKDKGRLREIADKLNAVLKSIKQGCPCGGPCHGLGACGHDRLCGCAQCECANCRQERSEFIRTLRSSERKA